MGIADVARYIAVDAHGTQTNKHDGTLYILHPLRVGVASRKAAQRNGLRPAVCEAVGYLHDVLEDTHFTASDLIADLMDGGVKRATAETIVENVEILSKRKGEANRDYYERVSRHPIARQVKLMDIQDNFRRNHLITDEATLSRMASKYSLGIHILS